MIGISYYTPTPTQVDDMGKIALAGRCEKLIYKQIDTNYLAYHPFCRRQGMIDKKTLSQAKRTHLCPFCFNEIKSTTKESRQVGHNFVRITTNGETFGYYVMYDFELGKPIVSDCEQVLYASGNECYHKYIKPDIFAHHLAIHEDLDFWKWSKRNHYSFYFCQDRSTYEDCMYDFKYWNELARNCQNKKEYLQKNADFIVKSNQKKLVIDELFTPLEMEYIKVFDLKNAEDVLKYRKYMEKNKWHVRDFLSHKETLNVYYLDYLSRNKIDLGKYFTYLHNLKLLGFKYDKPKDFEHRYKKVEEMIEAQKNKLIEEKIANRFAELPKYDDGKVAISPFKSSQEIRDCGKRLHNCIGGYVTRYANSETDIYHVDLDGAIEAALEIRKSELVQAYEDRNGRCRGELLNSVRTFCNQNGIALGNWA